MQIDTQFEALLDGLLPERQQVDISAHLKRCDSCSSALYAVEQLRASGRLDVPKPRAGFLSQVVENVTQYHSSESSGRRDRFWLGAATGSAIAAGIVVALMNFASLDGYQPVKSSPKFSIALNETRDVNVAIDSPVEMMDAAIRVVLTGAVALAGYENQSELRWRTDLDAGVNMLSLPVTMVGTRGGQVLVEVTHEQRHEIFVVTLPGSAPQAGVFSGPETTTAGAGKFSRTSELMPWMAV